MPALATADEVQGGRLLVSAVPAGWRTKRRFRWVRERWTALAALAVALPIALPAVRGTLDWLGRPFPGFFVMANGVIPTVGLYTWTGLGGGVSFHARVVAVDGLPVAGHANLYRYVDAHPVGTPFRYTLEKNGAVFTRTVPSMRFGLRDYWLTVGLLAIFGMTSMFMGVAVGLLQPRLRAAHAYLAQGILGGLYALTGTALYNPDLEALSRLHHVVQATFPAAMIHLGLTFPVTRDFIRRRPAWLLVPYAFGLLLSAWVYVDFYAPTPDIVPLYVSYLWAAVSIIAVIGLVAYSYRENRTPMVRHQLRIVLPGLVIGTTLGLIGFLDNMRSGGEFPINLIALPPLVFFAAIAYAIVRRDLFDVDNLIRQTATYVTLTALITAIYVTAVTLLGLSFHSGLVWVPPLTQVAFVVAVAFLFQPLRSAVQHVLDRTFFRARPDYRTIVRDVSTALRALLDLERILDRVEDTVRGGFQLESLAVVLWLDDGAHVWRRGLGNGTLQERFGPSFDALHNFLERDLTCTWMIPDAELAPAACRTSDPAEVAVRAEMAELGAVLVLPIAAGDSLLGAFAIGPRVAAVPFGPNDVELLRTVVAQASVAIQNALSYRQVQEARSRLEERVRERTAELERSTAELEQSNAQLARSKADLETALGDLRAAQTQLLQTEKLASLGQLVAGVAHEINNPVTFIVGNIEPMREELAVIRERATCHADGELDAAAERVDRMVGLIREGAERTAGIVQDLRTFSRVGGAVPQPTDLNEGIEVTLRLLRPKWGTRITIHRDYGVLPPVRAVPSQVNQVFMNLLANACDAIAERGNIWIMTRLETTGVRVVIRDDGTGIASEDMGRIFDPFFTTKPQGQGTGLGLAITYGIVEAHGGRIAVESRPGAGTTVTLTIPLEPPAAGQVATKETVDG